MNYQWKALPVSIAIHVAIVIAIIFLSNTFVYTREPLVIDFTVGNAGDSAGGSGKRLKSKTGKNVSVRDKLRTCKKEVSESKKEPVEVEDPKPECLVYYKH